MKSWLTWVRSRIHLASVEWWTFPASEDADCCHTSTHAKRKSSQNSPQAPSKSCPQCKNAFKVDQWQLGQISSLNHQTHIKKQMFKDPSKLKRVGLKTHSFDACLACVAGGISHARAFVLVTTLRTRVAKPWEDCDGIWRPSRIPPATQANACFYDNCRNSGALIG